MARNNIFTKIMLPMLKCTSNCGYLELFLKFDINQVSQHTSGSCMALQLTFTVDKTFLSKYRNIQIDSLLIMFIKQVSRIGDVMIRALASCTI